MGNPAAGSPSALQRTFASLGHRAFARYLGAQMPSAIGDWLAITAINILVLQMSGGGAGLGLVNAAVFLPTVILAPWAGALSDRYGRGRILLVSNCVLPVIAVAIGLLRSTGVLTLPVLYAAVGVIGVVEAFNAPARNAFVGDLVPAPTLPNAAGLYATATTVARAAGPLVAAVVVPTLGVPAALYLDAASFLTLIAVLPGLAGRRPDASATRPARPSGLAGLKAGWPDVSIRMPLLIVAVVSGFGITSTVLLPLLVTQTLHAPGRTYAVLAGVMGAGTVVGSIATAARPVVGDRPVSARALTLAAMLAVVSVCPSALAAAVPLLLCGVLAAAALVTTQATLQVRSGAMRGKVMGAYSAVYAAASATVMPLMGVVAGATSPRTGYRISAGVIAVTAVIILTRRSRPPRAADDAASRSPDAHDDGPVRR